MKAEISRNRVLSGDSPAPAAENHFRPKVLVLEGTSRIGGGQSVTLLTAKSLKEHIDFQVVVPGPGRLADALTDADLVSHRLNYPSPAGKFGLLDRITYLPRGLASLGSLISLIRRTKPHLLYATSRTVLWAVLAGRITGTPVVVHLHMIPPTSRTAGFLRRVCSMKPVKKVLVASPAIADRLGLPEELVSIAPNGVDTAEFRSRPEIRDHVRSELGVGTSVFLAAVVGELSPEKGQLGAIEALARLESGPSDTSLLIVGAARDGNEAYFYELRSTAHRLNVEDRVIFAGQCDDMSRVLNAVDLLLVPSIGPSGEACPMVVLEAWATGLPVLGADTGGLTQMLSGGRGELFEGSSVDSLAAGWQELAASSERRESMAAAGRESVAGEYSLENSSARIRAVVEEAISGEKSQAARSELAS